MAQAKDTSPEAVLNSTNMREMAGKLCFGQQKSEAMMTSLFV